MSTSTPRPPAARALAAVTAALTVAGGLALVGGVALAPAASAASGPLHAAPVAASTTMDDVTHLVGADRAWARGVTGAGVDVALIDTGVVPVPGLDAADQVVLGPDLSFDGQDPATASLDGFGHGTHLAGLIAGRGAGHQGVAPGARLLSVKVGASDGAVDVSQVIAALDWTVQHAHDGDLDVRVVNLSLGTDSAQDARLDPLAKAVDNAWRHGIVVVAAVGNDGTEDLRVADPAADPNVLAVGATDSGGSREPARSRVAAFSAAGRERTADLLAPGARVLSLRAPGSLIDETFPQARVGDALRGSGTSQSAAVVSGAVALLLQARPELTPDQVKALLTRTAAPVVGGTASTGKGQLDVAAALLAPTPRSVPALVPLAGTGTLDASRGTSRVEDDGVVLRGERDVLGAPFDSRTWVPRSEQAAAWVGGTWNGTAWTGDDWGPATTAAGAPWSGRTWSGRTWSGRTWSGRTWSGRTWSGRTWSGRTWSGRTWSGESWAGAAFTGRTWSADTWAGRTWSGTAWG